MGHETKITVDELTRLMTAVSRTAEATGCSLGQVIKKVERALSGGSTADIREKRAALGSFVGNLRRMRIRRKELIGADLFRDPAWDMLLELYAAHQRGEALSVSSLCYASGSPPTTALRHVNRLIEHGLIVRVGDCSDQRRILLKPTERSIEGVETMASLLIQQSKLVEPQAD